jgi:methylated-DNA-[protein]-cysteine S-methyltransferase
MPHIAFPTPFGDLSLFEERGALVAVEWGRAAGTSKPTPLLKRARKQIDEYFEGKRKKFTLPFSLTGTEFQKRVWMAIARIPYGHTASYGDVAHQVDSGPRAVGGACAHNPIGLIVPCHRVLASQGQIGGYGTGGLALKRQLLRLEGLG